MHPDTQKDRTHRSSFIIILTVRTVFAVLFVVFFVFFSPVPPEEFFKKRLAVLICYVILYGIFGPQYSKIER